MTERIVIVGGGTGGTVLANRLADRLEPELESGDVEVANDGSVEVVGVLATNADVPNTVDVFTEGLETGAEATTTLRIVSGESRESVRKNIPVVVHGATLNSPDDSRERKAYVYASGNPVTWDGSTRYGYIEQDSDGSSIHAYTAADGVLVISVDNTPSRFDQISWFLANNTPDWIPGVVFITQSALSVAILPPLVIRRRSGWCWTPE